MTAALHLPDYTDRVLRLGVAVVMTLVLVAGAVALLSLIVMAMHNDQLYGHEKWTYWRSVRFVTKWTAIVGCVVAAFVLVISLMVWGFTPEGSA